MSDDAKMLDAIKAAKEAVADGLNETVYTCSRVWSAWGYGTMSEDDFAPAWEDDELVDDLATVALDAANGVLAPAKIRLARAVKALESWSRGEGWRDGVEDLVRELAEAHEATDQDVDDKWVTVVGIGGLVCSACETPVESEPCELHQPHAYANQTS